MKNELVDRIANGNATLLGVDDICKRLGVSRSTLRHDLSYCGNPSVGGFSLRVVAGQQQLDLYSNKAFVGEA